MGANLHEVASGPPTNSEYRVMRLVAPILVCAAFVGAVLGGCGNARSGDAQAEDVTMPQVVGMSQSRAECLLEARDLRWRYGGDTTVRQEPIIPCGSGTAVTPDARVVRQDPVAGTHLTRRATVSFETECTLRRRTAEAPCA